MVDKIIRQTNMGTHWETLVEPGALPGASILYRHSVQERCRNTPVTPNNLPSEEFRPESGRVSLTWKPYGTGPCGIGNLDVQNLLETWASLGQPVYKGQVVYVFWGTGVPAEDKPYPGFEPRVLKLRIQDGVWDILYLSFRKDGDAQHDNGNRQTSRHTAFVEHVMAQLAPYLEEWLANPSTELQLTF